MLRTRNLIEFFRQVDFLAEARDEVLQRIARQVEARPVPADTEIFADQEPGDAMYFIVSGTVRIEKLRQLLLKRGPGDYIGEMALADDSPRSAAAIAETDVVLLRWKKDSFQEALESDGHIAYQVCRAFCTKIREGTETVSLFQQDLERAVLLQRALLPEETFDNSMIEIRARCLQAERVGGDYFDYLPFSEQQTALVMADAQGHGFAAALLAAMLKTRLHSRAAHDRSPSRVMAALNRTLTNQINSIQTATGIYLLLDSQTHELHFCSAGHIPQYHYRADQDTLEELGSGNLLLGFQDRDSSALQTTVRPWGSGDLLVLFTDGVTEATSNHEGANHEGANHESADEEFGTERLRELVWRHRHREAGEVLQEILQGVRDFHGTGPFNDDVTLLVARLL